MQLEPRGHWFKSLEKQDQMSNTSVSGMPDNFNFFRLDNKNPQTSCFCMQLGTPTKIPTFTRFVSSALRVHSRRSFFLYQLQPSYYHSIVFPYSRGQKLRWLMRPHSGVAIRLVLLTDLSSDLHVVIRSSCFSDRNIWDFLCNPDAALGWYVFL